MCQNCNTLYFNCEANGCYLAWRTVKELCAMKHIEGPQGFDVTSIMALPLKIKSPDGSPRPGATRLLLIAASECVFLLWKLRCRRLFDDNDEIRNRHTDPQEVSDPSPIKSSQYSRTDNGIDVLRYSAITVTDFVVIVEESSASQFPKEE